MPWAWPTWTNLLQLLSKRPEAQNLWAVLHSWVYGALTGMFNQERNVNLDNQYVLLDITTAWVTRRRGRWSSSWP